jgi:succinate dehydrogenase / fumarate reductase cytochrome b subunit
MTRISKFYSSSIGKKFIAAVTGLILFGFLAGHVAGNLKAYTGSDQVAVAGADPVNVPHIDQYGHFLRVVGEPLVPKLFVLWGARVVLLASVVLHIMVVVQLSLKSAEARPVDYVKSKKAAASWAARYMMVSGLVVLGFIIFHLLHFTAGVIVIGDFEEGKVYNNLRSSFQNPIIAIGYVVVMAMLAFHMYHGVWSLFQTLGLDNPDRNKFLRAFAIITSVGIAVGFASVPLAFLSGMLPDLGEYPRYLLEK